MNAFTLPNLLSLSRAILAPVAFWVIIEANWLAASWILLVALITDLADGALARRWQQMTALGGFLDHASDAFLVTCILAGLSVLELITPILPPLVMIAFVQYTLDSNVLKGQPLRASTLGRYNGILYFIVTGFPIIQPVVEIVLLNDNHIMWFSWALVVTTGLSILDRAIALVRIKRIEKKQ